MNTKSICTYCDNAATTADHVPPKLLFAKPRPHLITVPACRKCNQSASLDDEYFRTVITLEEKAGEHPEAKQVIHTVLRSLQKPKKIRFRHALLSTIQEVDRVSPAGLYLGRTSTFNVDLTRLTRVIERITRGLFLHHTNRRLPVNCNVTSFAASGLSITDIGVREAVLDLVEQTRKNELYTIGNNVFSYRYAIANDQDNSSAWVFVVYEAISFISFTIDHSLLQNSK